MEYVCGHAVDDTDRENATGTCLKIATDAEGHWFTSSPSLAVMNALGYSANDKETNSGNTYAAIYTKNGTRGPNGEFVQFQQDGLDVVNPEDSVGIDGQFDRWCQTLASIEFAGKNNWHRPSKDELLGLYQGLLQKIVETEFRPFVVHS